MITHACWYGARVEGQWVYVGPVHPFYEAIVGEQHIIEFPPTGERRIVSAEVLERDYGITPKGGSPCEQ